MSFFGNHYETIEEQMKTQDQLQAKAVLKRLEQIAYAGFQMPKNQDLFDKAIENFKKTMGKIK